MPVHYTQPKNDSVNISDLHFHAYQQRQLNEIRPGQIIKNSMQLVPAGNFHFNNATWMPNEYMGYAIVSMLNNNPGNEDLIKFLISIQQILHENIQPINGFYMLPADSLHQTIANTLSNENFKKNILCPGIEACYPAMVANAFHKISMIKQDHPLRMKLIGLSIFGTSLGILGVFESKGDYNRIVRFRSGFYNNEKLHDLDIKMTRPFIGHITLAYCEQKLNKNQKEYLASIINEINENIGSQDHYFMISNTGLRRYNHLAEFQDGADFPVYDFTYR